MLASKCCGERQRTMLATRASPADLLPAVYWPTRLAELSRGRGAGVAAVPDLLARH